MCLIIFANDYHPRYQLVVAANRDEFYKRPAYPAAFWEEHPWILAGKDAKEGGTWLGITIEGRFAVLTNYRDPASFKAGAPSRGNLVLDYLRSEHDPVSFVKKIPEGGEAYNGFNLLLGSVDSLYYYSNREKKLRKVEKGFHGLSNSLLDVPWPKVTKGRERLAAILNKDSFEVEELFYMMMDREEADDKNLPSTGVSLEMERWLSPAFITSREYGTRVTTVITADRQNRIRFWERSFDPQQISKYNEVYYEFEIRDQKERNYF
jgi:uncharacterized protein with NRDE domain